MRQAMARVLLIGIVLWMGTEPVGAGGVFQQLPKDGSWAEYYLQFTMRDQETTGSLRVRSVGQQQFNGQTCRWLELELKVPEGADIEPGLVKMLVPEQAITAEESIQENILKGYYRDGEGRVNPFSDLNKLNYAFFTQFCTGGLENVKKEPIDKSLDFQKGKLELTERIKGTASATLVVSLKPGMVTWRVESDYNLILHEKVPFGLASSKVKHVLHIKDKQRPLEVKLTLTDYGNDAKSALPEHK